ncbi:hypothetical protein BSKO_05948 [Bryopsis sp. KO-2023]|nr:hypothetical protein BSKO_05948 [Bryopsis sp. KO-2023]
MEVGFSRFGISEFFRKEGAFVTRNPWTVIFLTSLLAAVGSLPLIDYGFPGKGPFPFVQELDKDRLYSPISAPALKDREYVEKVYGDDVLLTSVFMVAKNPEGGNVLSKSHLLELMDLWEIIAGLEVNYEGVTYGWEDVCSKSKLITLDKYTACKAFSILDAWNLDRTSLLNDPDVLETITRKTVNGTQEGAGLAAAFSGAINAAGSPLFRGLLLGSKGIEYGPDGRLTEASAFRISLFKKTNKVELDGKFFDPVEFAWENAVVEVVHGWEGPLLKGYVGSFNQVDEVSEREVTRETFWVILSYSLVVLVSHMVLFRNSRAFCKMHLTFVSIVAITIAIASSHGIVNLLGVPYNLVVRTVPFLLVGLGMDDTFVIMGAYSMVPHDLPLEQRIAETMKQAGSSIMVTSVTDFVAFTVGTFATIPAVQVFCLYASVGVLFDFLFQVTFFVAFVVLDAKREARANKGVRFFGLGKQIEKKSFQTDSSGGSPPQVKDITRMSTNKQMPGGAEKFVGNNSYPKWFGKGQFDPAAPSLSRRVIGEILPSLTLSSMGKIVVILIELATLGLAIYGCTQVYTDFRYFEWFTPKGSSLERAVQIEDTYFQGEQFPFSIYTKEAVDGRDYFYHQEELSRLSAAVVNSPYISKEPIPASSWYDNFLTWSRAFKSGQVDANGLAPNATIFNEWVKEFLDTRGHIFLDAVVFSEDGSRIVSSRMVVFTRAVEAMGELLDDVDIIRTSVGEAAPNLEAFAYGFAFPFLDSFRTVTSETINNVISAAAAVFFICLFILADFVTTACVVLMIALTDVFLFGFMHFGGLQFNIVTSINIILAVGIAVDYSSHIAHSFLVATGTREERAQKALYHIGGEVFSGAFTTWVAVLGLGFASHYIFTVFFKMFFVIVVAGLWHGLIVLPVVLSLVGSSSYRD